MTPEVGKYYWIRLYRDDAEWRPAQLVTNQDRNETWWEIIGQTDAYYDTEINEIGSEIVPPRQ